MCNILKDILEGFYSENNFIGKRQGWRYNIIQRNIEVKYEL